MMWDKLQQAIINHDNPTFFKLLGSIHSETKINEILFKKDQKNDWTLLNWACFLGNSDIVNQLLTLAKRHAFELVTLYDKKKCTSIDQAILSRNPNVVHSLLNIMGDQSRKILFTQNCFGRTPLEQVQDAEILLLLNRYISDPHLDFTSEWEKTRLNQNKPENTSNISIRQEKEELQKIFNQMIDWSSIRNVNNKTLINLIFSNKQTIHFSFKFNNETNIETMHLNKLQEKLLFKYKISKKIIGQNKFPADNRYYIVCSPNIHSDKRLVLQIDADNSFLGPILKNLKLSTTILVTKKNKKSKIRSCFPINLFKGTNKAPRHVRLFTNKHRSIELNTTKDIQKNLTEMMRSFNWWFNENRFLNNIYLLQQNISKEMNKLGISDKHEIMEVYEKTLYSFYNKLSNKELLWLYNKYQSKDVSNLLDGFDYITCNVSTDFDKESFLKEQHLNVSELPNDPHILSQIEDQITLAFSITSALIIPTRATLVTVLTERRFKTDFESCINQFKDISLYNKKSINKFAGKFIDTERVEKLLNGRITFDKSHNCFLETISL